MCKKDDEALRLLREVVTDSPGRPEEGKKKNDNISSSSGHGTSKDYTLDRLAREDAELYEKVVAEEMNRLRSTVKDLLNPDAAEHGGDRKSEEAQDQVRNTKSKSTDDESYALRRLKRDHPGAIQDGTASIPYKSGLYDAERGFLRIGLIRVRYRSL